MFVSAFRRNAAVIVVCMLAVSACSSTYRNHGYVPPEEDLQNIVIGVDTRATVDDVVGPPTTAGLLGDGDYYYVRDQVRHFGMKRPEIIDRQVLAISFDSADVVANIERFGLKDGHIVHLSRRATNTTVEGNGFLRQMMGNFGRLNPGEFF